MKRTTNLKVLENLMKKRNDYIVKVGWFENSKYSDGTPIGGIAAVQNYGAVINHPGGTHYFPGKDGKIHYVSNEKGGNLPKTAPHTIVIPPTHFMEKAIGENKETWKELSAQAWQAVFLGNETEDNAMKKLGMAVEGAIAKTITEINQPPLKQSTKDKRLSKYKNKKIKKGAVSGIDKRLISTGEMLNALSHSVETL